MTAGLVAGAALPLLQQLFPPVPLDQQLQQTPILMLAVIECCLAAAYLALWRAAPDFRAFRPLGIFFAFIGAQQFSQYFGGFVPYWSLRAIAGGVLVECAGEAMQVPHRRWARLLWPIYLFVSIAVWFPPLAFTREWPMPVSEIPILIFIVYGFRRGSERDKMIAGAFLFYSLVRLTISGPVQRLLGIRDYADIGGWHWQYTTFGTTVLGTVTLAIFVHDLIRDRSEKQRLAAELAASRAVQQVLIPEQLPSVPGYKVHSVYKPFGDVGGDFFQIIPLPGDGAVIAIGDVSGKGMPAAMMVSLLVGTLHALVEATTSPGRLLAGLNRLVQGRSRGGFTTCLILRVEADGVVTFANAGHISPYRNAVEVECDNGLPLGLVAGASYAEGSFKLNAGEQLTLVTDGVVEARNEAGELFGFERTAQFSSNTAEAIVQAAQAFGQEDDITVLTVRSVTACA
jgi:Stage II sporulation protein E (SpoIIE)